MRGQVLAVLAIGAMGVTAGAQAPADRPRARDLGLAPGVFEPGPLNAITDVHGVTVGHVTLNQGDSVRTGVTAILPHAGNLFQDKVAGAVFVGNAFGKLAGSTQVEELGTIETPIVLTNTLARRRGRGRRRAVDPGARRQRQRPIGQCAGRRDQRRRVERHPQPAGASVARRRSHPRRPRRSGRRRQRRGRHRNARVRVEGRHRHRLASPAGPPGRLHRRGPRAEQLRRGADDGWGAGGPRAWPLRLRAVGPGRRRRRLLHDRRGHRCAARRPRPDAPGRAGGLRPGPHRLVVLQRQRRFRDCVQHAPVAARDASATPAPRPRTLLPTDGVSPLFQAALEATEEAVYNSLLRPPP